MAHKLTTENLLDGALVRFFDLNLSELIDHNDKIIEYMEIFKYYHMLLLYHWYKDQCDLAVEGEGIDYEFPYAISQNNSNDNQLREDQYAYMVPSLSP